MFTGLNSTSTLARTFLSGKGKRSAAVSEGVFLPQVGIRCSLSLISHGVWLMSTIWADLKMCTHKAVIACYQSSDELNQSWIQLEEYTRKRTQQRSALCCPFQHYPPLRFNHRQNLGLVTPRNFVSPSSEGMRKEIRLKLTNRPGTIICKITYSNLLHFGNFIIKYSVKNRIFQQFTNGLSLWHQLFLT